MQLGISKGALKSYSLTLMHSLCNEKSFKPKVTYIYV